MIMRKLSIILITLLLSIFVTACANDSSKNSNNQSSELALTHDNSSEGSGSWEPQENITFVAPAGAGGGWDTTAREAARVFNETGIIEQSIGVVNQPGGGGAVAWADIHSKNGSPYHLFVSSPPLILVPLNGQSEYNHEDFTPLANLISDYGSFAVRADSEWETLNDLFEDMKEDPSDISIVGGSSPGSMDHMQFVKVAKAAGVDITKIKYVSDQEGGALTQLLNGSADVFTTDIAETVEHVRAGKIKVLGITSEERLEGEILEDFPTAVEQGIDATFVNWRGFFGPPNMDQVAIDYYEQKFKELSDSEDFANVRAKYGWNEFYMDSEEYKDFLNNERDSLQVLLNEMGLGN